MNRILLLILPHLIGVSLAWAQPSERDIVQAVDRDDTATIEALCAESPQTVLAITDPGRGRTLAHRAILRGHLDVLQVLHTRCGMAVDALDGDQRSPIEMAVSGNHADVALYLIEQGVDVNYVRRPPVPPGYPERADPLIKTVIHAQAPLPVLEAMIRAGADLSLTDAEGYNVLHICTLADNYNAAELLLRRYKNSLHVDATDQAGNLPIAYARSEEMAALFRRYNAY